MTGTSTGLTSGLLATLDLARGPVDAAREWIGRTEPAITAPRRIGVSQVELFAALVRDENPRYWSTVDDLPVPPGLLMAYALPLPWSPRESAPRPIWARIPLPGDTLINVTTSTVFHRELRTGDRVRIREEVVAVSDEKSTRLGRGHFLTTRAVYDDERGLVAEHTNLMLRYHSDSAPPPAPARSDADGQTPDVTIPVTPELCVHNVAATGDFFPGHYNPAYARSQGVPDTYLNTMFFHGLVDQVAQRRHPNRRLVRRDLTMRSPAFIGETVAAAATPSTVDDSVVVTVWTERGPCTEAQVWFGADGEEAA